MIRVALLFGDVLEPSFGNAKFALNSPIDFWFWNCAAPSHYVPDPAIDSFPCRSTLTDSPKRN